MSEATPSITVRSMQSDTVDAICWRVYGEQMNSSAIVEKVLQMNQGLADMGAVLPMGTLLSLPVLTQTTTKKEVVQLWT